MQQIERADEQRYDVQECDARMMNKELLPVTKN